MKHVEGTGGALPRIYSLASQHELGVPVVENSMNMVVMPITYFNEKKTNVKRLQQKFTNIQVQQNMWLSPCDTCSLSANQSQE